MYLCKNYAWISKTYRLKYLCVWTPFSNKIFKVQCVRTRPWGSASLWWAGQEPHLKQWKLCKQRYEQCSAYCGSVLWERALVVCGLVLGKWLGVPLPRMVSNWSKCSNVLLPCHRSFAGQSAVSLTSHTPQCTNDHVSHNSHPTLQWDGCPFTEAALCPALTLGPWQSSPRTTAFTGAQDDWFHGTIAAFLSLTNLPSPTLFNPFPMGLLIYSILGWQKSGTCAIQHLPHVSLLTPSPLLFSLFKRSIHV